MFVKTTIIFEEAHKEWKMGKYCDANHPKWKLSLVKYNKSQTPFPSLLRVDRRSDNPHTKQGCRISISRRDCYKLKLNENRTKCFVYLKKLRIYYIKSSCATALIRKTQRSIVRAGLLRYATSSSIITLAVFVVLCWNNRFRSRSQ